MRARSIDEIVGDIANLAVSLAIIEHQDRKHTPEDVRACAGDLFDHLTARTALRLEADSRFGIAGRLRRRAGVRRKDMLQSRLT